MTTELEDSSVEGLAERMKRYEAVTDLQLPADQPAIIRIDGHAFSKFTRGFDKPFDERIHAAMAATAADLLAEFPDASLAYTQSDEITLVFPAGARAFNGRAAKLSSLSAGLASARFNYHLARGAEGTAPVPAEKLGVAHFDARAFSVPDPAEALNNLIWRAKIDCRRNSISAFERGFYSTKEKLAEKNIDFWTSSPSWARYGTTVKRQQYEGKGTDGLTGAEVTVTRTRVKSGDIPWWEFNERNLALVSEKFWGNDAPGND
ncbi:tRNAHis guanylyltransferase-domain-containing protein [Mycena pura]|uniref:tRNA(His) guanylyltransferase n=1 Tax=Mycena pura TaxID=153505 RepID=A0AAD6YS00_9AGAR|nr:tRNAHis guanylyltransferase-domain-containing protein [Mycena pura]